MPRTAADPVLKQQIKDFNLHVALIENQNPEIKAATIKAWMEGPMGLKHRLGQLPLPIEAPEEPKQK
jgi:hypothetical protein